MHSNHSRGESNKKHFYNIFSGASACLKGARSGVSNAMENGKSVMHENCSGRQRTSPVRTDGEDR